MTRTEWAGNLSRDQHWIEWMDELRQAEYTRFANSAALDIDTREDAYRRIKIYDEMQAHLESLAMTATMKEKRWKIL